jgi:hypothetical protein
MSKAKLTSPIDRVVVCGAAWYTLLLLLLLVVVVVCGTML